MQKRVVVTDHAFPDTRVERAVARRHGATFDEFAATTEAETIAAVRGADVVLVNVAPVTARAIGVLATGAVVIRYGVGYDNVDVDAARRAGVQVATVGDYGSDTVADHAATLLLACLRRLPQFDHAVRSDGWCDPLAFGAIPSFATLCVGIVGLGRIGLALADRLRPFGFALVAYDPYVDPTHLAHTQVDLVDLPTLLTRADAITLHLPLTQQTHHLVGVDFLSMAKRGAILVNTARGGLVDTAALAHALSDGTIAFAGLDVYETEPLSSDSDLRDTPRAILTPHIAFYSEQSMARLQQLASEEVGRALNGLAPRHPIV